MMMLRASKRLPTKPENRIRVVSGRHGHRIGVNVNPAVLVPCSRSRYLFL